MKRIVSFLILALSFFIVACEKDQLQGELTGKVYFTGTKIPISKVLVEIRNQQSETDISGNYRLRIELGRYQVTSKKDGFDTFRDEVEIIHGVIEKDIHMTSPDFTTRVFGTVRGNHSGRTQSGVKIVLMNPDDTESQILDFSNSSGNFSLNNVPRGERMIVVIHEGVIIFQENLELDDSSYELNILLPEPFTFIDPRDNQEYWALKLGTQIWMIENLAWLPKVTGPGNGSYDDPYYYLLDYYGNSVSEAKVLPGYSDYGVFYNWEAAKISCPPGWHLPSDEEWKVLELFLGLGHFDTISDGARLGGEIGKKMKSTQGWNNQGNGDNSSHFNVLPVGIRFDTGGFDEYGYRAIFWTSTESGEIFAWGRGLGGNVHWVDRDRFDLSNGMSVRCVKYD